MANSWVNVGGDAIGDAIGVAAEDVGQRAMTRPESFHEVGQRPLHLALVEVEDSADDDRGAGLASGQQLLPGDEQSGNDAGRIRQEPMGAPYREAHSHAAAGTRWRACCSVEMSASVDSAPSLRLGPSWCRPS